MPAQIEVIDSFEWAGGQGRFSPGMLGSDAWRGDRYYYVGGMFGALAFTLGFAIYWPGGAHHVCSFLSPLFQPFPAGGCDANATPPKQCIETLSQLDFGDLYVDAAGGLHYAGKSYLGTDYAAIPFAASTAGLPGPRLVARAWNYVELKMELAGAYPAAGGESCGTLDVDPGAFGLLAARINDGEVMRYRQRTGEADKVAFTTCACFLCQAVPLGVGVVHLRSDPPAGMGIDDFLFRSWDMHAGEDDWIGDSQSAFLAAAGVGSSAGWTPVGAPTNWQAAATDDGATSYNRTNETGKRDALALAVSTDTRPVTHVQPALIARSEYKVGGGPPTRAFYRRGGIEYPTAPLAPDIAFGQVGAGAGVPTVGETLASLSAGEIGYTTE